MKREPVSTQCRTEEYRSDAIECQSSGIPPVTLLVLGDSVALGADAIDGVRVISRVARSFVEVVAEQCGWRLVVDAAPLRTTVVAAQRVARLIRQHQPACVLIATGANDVDIDWRRFAISRGRLIRSRTPIAQYSAALTSIVEAGAAAQIPVCIGETMSCTLEHRMAHLSSLFGDEVVDWVEAGGGQQTCNGFVRSFRAASKHVARSHGAVHVPMGSGFDAGRVEHLLAADGTHPNQDGHDLLARVCLKQLRPLASRGVK